MTKRQVFKYFYVINQLTASTSSTCNMRLGRNETSRQSENNIL